MVGGAGLGVGGIEAEAAMLGQPTPMLIPEVVGFKLTGKLKEGTTATDLVLTVTQMLRRWRVGSSWNLRSGPERPFSPDRATIATWRRNTVRPAASSRSTPRLPLLLFSGRDPQRVALVEAYAKAQGMWRDESTPDPVFTATLALDSAPWNRPSPDRSVRRIAWRCRRPRSSSAGAQEGFNHPAVASCDVADLRARRQGEAEDGDVVIAAITSCTNTSNPSVLFAAGLLARKAREKG